MEKKREALTTAVLEVLTDYPKGIKRDHLWNYAAKKLGKSPKASDYGFGKMSQMFPLIEHLYVVFKDGKDVMIKLRSQAASRVEVISSDDDDFPSLLTGIGGKAKGVAKETAQNTPRRQRLADSPKPSRSEDFLSFDTGGLSMASGAPSASSSSLGGRTETKLNQLKEQIVKLIRKEGKIMKGRMWLMFQKEYKTTPSGADYGVKKMADVFDMFKDVIEERRIEGENYLVLRGSGPQKKPTARWGQGANVAPGIGRTSHDQSSSSSSSDESDSDCIIEETKTFVNSLRDKAIPQQTVDAQKAGQAYFMPGMAGMPHKQPMGQPLIQGPRPLMSMPLPIRPLHQPSMFPMFPRPTGQGHMPSPQQGQLQGYMPSPQQGHPGIAAAMNIPRMPVGGGGQRGEPMATPRERSQSRDRHSSRESRDGTPFAARQKIERKDIQVASVPRGRGFPTRDQVDAIAKECISIIAESNEYVSLQRIEQLVCRRYEVRDIRELQIRHIEQLPSVNEHNRMICKVNLYIQAFVKSRAVCTVFELHECMREFAKDRNNFESLKLGPLQMFPMVYDMFKYPYDEEIQEITTMDILEHVADYLNSAQKWTEKLEMEPLMEHFINHYRVDNAYQLGIRIRSLPLTVQMLKKSRRDAAANRRSVTEEFKEQFKKDLTSSFKKFQAAILQSGEDGGSEVRGHYLKLRPEVAVMEIFQKFQLLLSIDQPETRAAVKRHKLLEGAITGFLSAVRSDNMACSLFHLAVCVSDTTLQEAAMELLAPPSPQSQESESKGDNSGERQPPSKDAVVQSLRNYLERCLDKGALTLQYLNRIEEKLLEDFKYKSFQDMGFDRFLHFLLSEHATKSLLDEAGGTSLGSTEAGGEASAVYKPHMTDVLEMVLQCQGSGVTQNNSIEGALKEQYLVSDLKQLGCGSIARIIMAASKPGKHKSSEYRVLYEAAVTTTTSHAHQGQSKVGILGHQSRDLALACLHNCPLLEDLSEWSHWPMVFEPQHGKLKDFVQKYGRIHKSHIDGGTKTVTTDIIALETQPSKLLKLVSQTSPEMFQHALSKMDVSGTCGHLVSMVIMNKGLQNTPIALLANHMKTTLFSMHASVQTPGGPPQMAVADPAVTFVLECLVKLPVRLCVAVANQVFLEPLGQVVGATKSKSLLLSSCPDERHLHQIEKLGCLLGVQEWTDSFMRKCQPPAEAVADLYSPSERKELMEQGEEMVGLESDDEESESESESESSGSDLIDFLSDEEKEPEEKMEKEGKEQEIDKDDGEEKVEEESMEKKDSPENMKSESEEDDSKDGDDNEETDESSPKMNKEMEIIEQIRREEFGIGVELNEDGQRLMRVQQERLGRSLDRLSKDLYSKDTHFVLELVQNADDNSYPEEILKNEDDLCPSVKFFVEAEGVTVLNNECGFREKDIRALCDVGRSTKGKHKFGYIGQKGIGFKSVFRVTDGPEVHSKGFHIKFDVKSGPTGYILPHWVETEEDLPEGWTTKICLPLKEEMLLQTRSLAARFNDIHPSLLLFLHRLREITVQNKIEDSVVTMRRRDQGEGIVEIDHGTKVDRWLVIKKLLDASKISAQAKSGVDVESTEIALAFPLKNKDQKAKVQVLPSKQPVFAFLPLRSYGFRFIVQGDFDVPSSREDVDRDSPWNQWLRNEIHQLFIESLDVFKSHPNFSNMEALAAFLQFVPMEDEILDFFRPVASQILAKLRATECLPIQTSKKGTVQLKIPSQTVIIRDQLVKEVIPPDVLQKNLNLFYLHHDVALTLNPSLAQNLGVESITVEHLLQIGKSLLLSWDQQQTATKEKVLTAAKWLACIYRSLDEFQEYDAVLARLKSTRIIPLSTGQLVALDEVTVFLPPVDADRQTPRGDPISELHRDLSMLHAGLISTPDNEVNSQVQKLLNRLGVKQMSPHDIIHHHILPTLRTDDWQTKSRNILISYLIFIKNQAERQPSLINMAELKSLALVVTNTGIKKPSVDAVHFTPAYGNKIDLQRQLPGYDWVLLDAVYLNQATTHADINRWHDFFLQLGVTDFLHVTETEVHLTKDSMTNTPWAPLVDMWPESTTGYNFTDFSCEEFTTLVTQNKQPDKLIPQLQLLFEILDRDWDAKYSKFQMVQVKDGNGQILRDADSSFSIAMTTAKWVPGLTMSLVDNPGGGLQMKEEVSIMQPSLLYVRDPKLEQVLGTSVYYLAVRFNAQSSFIRYLRVKNTVEPKVVKDLLIEWGKREDPEKPKKFRTCLAHVKAVYRFLKDNLLPKDSQDLYHNNTVIFVPEARVRDGNDQNFVQGQMLGRGEVWWTDQSRLFSKFHNLLRDYHSDLADKHVIDFLYQDIPEIFSHDVRVETGPKLSDFAELLILIVTVHSPTDKPVLFDVLSIMARIGNESLKVKNNQGPVTELSILKNEIEGAMKKLKKQKIFPTKKDVWVSVDESPMIPDNREQEKMFAEQTGVHFINLEDPGSRDKRNKIRKAREQSRLNTDAINAFVDLFRIQKLSECVRSEPITEMSSLCPRLQNYAHQVLPYIQCFLYNMFPEIYDKLIDDNIKTMVKVISFQQVSKLEVIYTLENNPEPRIINPEKCVQIGNQFYFHISNLESFMDVNRELAKYFSAGDGECFKFLRNFLSDLHPSLNDQYAIAGVLDKHELEALPDDEEVWIIPPAIIPEPAPRPPSRQVSETSEPPVEGDGAMRSWPPKSSATGLDPESISGRKMPERSTQSRMWPPPKPPEYHQQVRHLPSNIKVVRSESSQSETSSEKGETSNTSRSGDGLRSGEYVIKEGEVRRQTSNEGQGQGYVRRQVSGEGQQQGERTGDRDGSVRAVQVSGEGQQQGERTGDREDGGIRAGHLCGGKRKLSDSEIDNEAKRPAPVGATSSHEPTAAGDASSTQQERSDRESSVHSNQGQTTPGTKRRHAPSEGEVVSTPKKPVFFKPGDATWTESASELVYEDIGGSDVVVPEPVIEDDNCADMSAVGRWGERLVRDYLFKQRSLHKDIIEIVWVNENQETGLPYDFEIKCFDETGQESKTVYIEVKSTLRNEKKHFEISSHEINFAIAKREHYQIYRVFNVGDPINVKLLRIDNTALKLDQKQLKLFMYI